MIRLNLAESDGSLAAAEARALAVSVRQRIDRLGISAAALSREAHVDRGTVTAMLNGRGVQQRSIAKVNRTLDRLEREAGVAEDEGDGVAAGLVSIEVEIPGGSGPAHAVVKGAPGDVAETVAKLLARLPVS
jgi:hypothetical protein